MAGRTQIAWLVCCLIYCLGLSAQAQTIAPFKKGDRVVFLGNSITERGHYHSYIWLYYMTRFPNLKLEIINAGVGGDRVSHMEKRFDSDVVPMKPTYLIVSFGMNDSGYEYNKPGVEAFAREEVRKSHEAWLALEQKIKALNIDRVALLGSPPYEENAALKPLVLKGKNSTIQEIVAFQRAEAQKNNWGFLDLNAPMLELNTRFQESDSCFTLCGIDRIHPDNDGHMVMAYLFLKAQGLAGLPVAGLTIDAAAKRVTEELNCKVSALKISDKELVFKYLARALPYPVDKVPRSRKAEKSQAEALKIVPFEEEMNREIFRIMGLKGHYELLIDGQRIGEWPAESLAQGINLATITETPQYQQALCLMHLNEQRWEAERRLRRYALIQYAYFQKKDLLFADNDKARESIRQDIAKNYLLQDLEDDYSKSIHPEIRNAWHEELEYLKKKIYRLNQPVVREIRLKYVRP